MSNKVEGWSPLESIRKYCLDCCLESSKEVRLCPAESCPLHPLQFGKQVKGISTLKTIRRKCLDCGAGTPSDVKDCEFTDCSLYQYRFGKNPNLVGKRGQGNPDFAKIVATFNEKTEE